MNGTDYAKLIIQRYREGENLNSLIVELETETLKGPERGLIDLKSDNDNGPSVRPWSALGQNLWKVEKYEEAAMLWQRMIIMANLTANAFYNNVAYVGLPLNNLGVTLIKMNRLYDGFHNFLKAFEFDIATSGSSSVALKNLLGLIPYIQSAQYKPDISVKKKTEEKIIKYSLYTFAGGILVDRILRMIIKCRGIEMNDLIYFGFFIVIVLISYLLPRIAKLSLSTSGINIEFSPFPQNTPIYNDVSRHPGTASGPR